MFLHAVDTGLQDEAIRNRLRPSLQTPGVQDEDLIQQMNVVVSEETERKSKLGTSNHHKSAKVRGESITGGRVGTTRNEQKGGDNT